MTARALGIDIGVRKGLDLVLMDDRRTPVVRIGHASMGDVTRVIQDYRPSIVAIDSPPRWASSGASRLTENELARLNIHAFRTPSAKHADGMKPNWLEWMREGMRVFRLVERLGYPLGTNESFRGKAIEVFPHASATVLAGCLPPEGMTKRSWRQRVLRMQGVRTEELTTVDLLDAALAALTGLFALDGHHFHPGDPKEGVIVVPVRVPAPVYRRGELADDSAKLFAYCACGECDLHVVAPREFARGHDAKRKSTLWRRAREGRDAIDELSRRGWEIPQELR